MMPALINAESGGNPNAVSPKGAGGLTQIMPATATDPGFGVKPLQGWDGVNPATATPAEQVRFGNDYLNAQQNRYGGNPQLAAAAYNAGPGRVDAALKQLPAETQNYVAKVAPFVAPRQNPNETIQAFQNRRNAAFEDYKLQNSAAFKQQEKQAETTGDINAKDIEAAKKADELTKRLDMNLQAMEKLNPDVPSSGFVPANAKVYLSQGLSANKLGSGAGAVASHQFDKINNDQILSDIQQFVATGGANTRINQTLEKIVQAASGIDKTASPEARAAMLKAARAEIANKNATQQNVVGGNMQYQDIPVVTGDSLANKSRQQFNAQKGVIPYTAYFGGQ